MIELVNLVKVKLNTKEKIIKETLSRIGIADRRHKILYPSCYLYYIKDEPYIVHFKQLFELTRDNGYKNISDEDLIRRNAVIFNLRNWGLIDVNEKDIRPYNKYVFVLPFVDKKDNNWQIKHKFNIAALDNTTKVK